MPDTNEVRRRIEAAERELATAKAELAEAERPKFDQDALYLIDSTIGRYLARGVVADDAGLNMGRYAAVNGEGVSGYLADPITDGLVFHRQIKKVAKVNV